MAPPKQDWRGSRCGNTRQSFDATASWGPKPPKQLDAAMRNWVAFMIDDHGATIFIQRADDTGFAADVEYGLHFFAIMGAQFGDGAAIFRVVFTGHDVCSSVDAEFFEVRTHK